MYHGSIPAPLGLFSITLLVLLGFAPSLAVRVANCSGIELAKRVLGSYDGSGLCWGVCKLASTVTEC